MKTTTTKPSAPIWYIVDATDQSIGRMSTRIAHVLRGKHKPTFSPHQLCGEQIIVINAEKMAVSPEKGRRKTYYDHTGHPGGISSRSLTKMMESKPKQVVEQAVRGMLPRNRLRNQIIKRLHVFVGSEHPYAPQKPVPLDLTTLL
jgi:large subunit ribosomal protein L13